MSHVSDRILKSIDESIYDRKIKEFLKTLLILEASGLAKSVRYGEDYDRIIKKYVRSRI